MPQGRPPIPVPLKRQVLVEAGHRCAIPTCRFPTTEVAHIVPYSKVRKHELDNLIALCPNCHTRYDRGEIDRKSILQYKRNVAIISSRYSDLERRILDLFVENPGARIVQLPGSLEVLVYYLLRDGLMEKRMPAASIEIGGVTATPVPYYLTDKGVEFVAHMREARELD